MKKLLLTVVLLLFVPSCGTSVTDPASARPRLFRRTARTSVADPAASARRSKVYSECKALEYTERFVDTLILGAKDDFNRGFTFAEVTLFGIGGCDDVKFAPVAAQQCLDCVASVANYVYR